MPVPEIGRLVGLTIRAAGTTNGVGVGVGIGPNEGTVVFGAQLATVIATTKTAKLVPKRNARASICNESPPHAGRRACHPNSRSRAEYATSSLHPLGGNYL